MVSANVVAYKPVMSLLEVNTLSTGVVPMILGLILFVIGGVITFKGRKILGVVTAVIGVVVLVYGFFAMTGATWLPMITP